MAKKTGKRKKEHASTGGPSRDISTFESDQRQQFDFAVPLLIAAAFTVVGALVGWLTGASTVPVVAHLIPILFGVLAGMSIGVLQSRIQAQRVARDVRELDDSQASRLEAVLSVFGEPNFISMRMWASSAILFCVACYLGTLAGLQSRVNHMPPLTELVASGDFCLRSDPTNGHCELPEITLAKLHHLRLVLANSDVDESEARELFQLYILPILERYRSSAVWNATDMAYPYDQTIENDLDIVIGKIALAARYKANAADAPSTEQNSSGSAGAEERVLPEGLPPAPVVDPSA